MFDTTTLRADADTRFGLPGCRDLRPGAIVAFRFPLESGAEPARPCLVLEVAFCAGHRFVTLAPGVARLPGRRQGRFDLKITPAATLPSGLLAGPTVFLGVKRLIVSERNGRFDRATGSGSAIIGQFTPGAMRRLQSLRRRIRNDVRCAQEQA